MSLSLALPYPPSLNTYWRHVGARVLISANGRAYRRAVAEAVMLARYRNEIPRTPITATVAVRIEAQMPDQRARDLDNLPKAILDSLTKAGLWVDDSQIDELTVIRIGLARAGAVRVLVSELQRVAA